MSPFFPHLSGAGEVRFGAVWLYFRFTLSFRDVEEMLAQRGIDVSYETIRCWTIKFGPTIARNLKRRRQAPSSRWHLDEMVVNIRGRHMYLWRAVDDTALLKSASSCCLVGRNSRLNLCQRAFVHPPGINLTKLFVDGHPVSESNPSVVHNTIVSSGRAGARCAVSFWNRHADCALG